MPGSFFSRFFACKVEDRLSGGRLRYYICTAFVSMPCPISSFLSAIPRLGAGFGIMYAVAGDHARLSMKFGLRRQCPLGIGGIALGFVGAMVAMTRSEVGKPPTSVDRAALLIPVFLAIGNVYRTLDWPKARSDRACCRKPSGVCADAVAGIFMLTGQFPVKHGARFARPYLSGRFASRAVTLVARGSAQPVISTRSAMSRQHWGLFQEPLCSSANIIRR